MDRKLLELLKKFIEIHSNIPDLQFNPDIHPKLPINPYSKDHREKRRTAHYLLLVASIDEGNIVGRADNARKLIVRFYQYFKENLFKITDRYIFEDILDYITADLSLGRLKRMIPEILASVNRFVMGRAKGDLISYSRMFQKPYNFVEEIGRNILRMGKSNNSVRKKSWMYMRWMVREHPDLRIFDHFSPRDLFVPLDRNVARVAVSLGVLKSTDNLNWEDVVKVTEFARTLYPEDPVKVDYPFFLLGREIRELKLPLNTENLKLLLKKKLYCSF
ncbi:DUF2400 family protein [Methanothermococcus sp. SCGC AD-155-N22]|nr:DUF2400 family protein [Methanothermococcus sp. SCGC AD-155-N22]